MARPVRAWGANTRTRLAVDEPTVGLLSNGEEPGKGDELRKRTFSLLEKVPGFHGNVEGATSCTERSTSS